MRERGIGFEKYIHFLLNSIVRKFEHEINFNGHTVFKETHKNQYHDIFIKEWNPDKRFDKKTYEDLFDSILRVFGYTSWEDFVNKENGRFIDYGKPQKEFLYAFVDLICEELKAVYLKNNLNEQDLDFRQRLAESLFEKAIRYESDNEFEKAISFIEKCLELNPDLYEYSFKWVELRLRTGSFENCIEKLEELLENVRSHQYKILTRHNMALALRAIAYKYSYSGIATELIDNAAELLLMVYDSVKSDKGLMNNELLIKVGINTCHILLEQKRYAEADQIFAYLYDKFRGRRFQNTYILLQLKLLEGLILRLGNESKAKDYFFNLLDEILSDFQSKPKELIAELTNILTTFDLPDQKKIELLKKCFPQSLFGNRYSDIEYRNMLQMGELLITVGNYKDAQAYLLKVLNWSLLSEDLKEQINKKLYAIAGETAI